MIFQTIIVKTDSFGVTTVTLNRPHVKNAFNDQMMEELCFVFQDQHIQNQTHCLVLKGQGEAFCSGGDIQWMKKGKDCSFEDNLKETQKLAHLFFYMNSFPRPVIASIHSTVRGGGVGFASVCDWVIATKNSEWGLSEALLGLAPACIAPFVISKIGVSQARKLFLSSTLFDGLYAQQIGLVHDVVTDVLELEKKTQEVVSLFLRSAPVVLEKIKKMIFDLQPPVSSAILEKMSFLLATLRLTPEAQEGLSAFLEKRTPQWPLA